MWASPITAAKSTLSMSWVWPGRLWVSIASAVVPPAPAARPEMAKGVSVCAPVKGDGLDEDRRAGVQLQEGAGAVAHLLLSADEVPAGIAAANVARAEPADTGAVGTGGAESLARRHADGEQVEVADAHQGDVGCRGAADRIRPAGRHGIDDDGVESGFRRRPWS